jgi:hypothetical protein
LKQNQTDPKLLWNAYVDLGSIHRAGDKFGIGGETARRVLHRAGFHLHNTQWSQDEDRILSDYYETCTPGTFDITEISIRLGRSYAGVACRVGEIGLRVQGYYPTPQQRERRSASQKTRLTKFHPNKGRRFGPMGKEHKEKISRGCILTFSEQRISGTGQFSNESRDKKSVSMSRLQTERILHGKYQGGKYRNGPRGDLGGMRYKSSWEANYARVLNCQIARGDLLSWDYEPDAFKVLVNGRTLHYIPDFRLTEPGTDPPRYVEVKGWMGEKARLKLEAMKICHPEVPLHVLMEGEYRELSCEYSSLIPQWEA